MADIGPSSASVSRLECLSGWADHCRQPADGHPPAADRHARNPRRPAAVQPTRRAHLPLPGLRRLQLRTNDKQQSASARDNRNTQRRRHQALTPDFAHYFLGGTQIHVQKQTKIKMNDIDIDSPKLGGDAPRPKSWRGKRPRCPPPSVPGPMMGTQRHLPPKFSFSSDFDDFISKMLENAKFANVSRKKILKYHNLWGHVPR